MRGVGPQVRLGLSSFVAVLGSREIVSVPRLGVISTRGSRLVGPCVSNVRGIASRSSIVLLRRGRIGTRGQKVFRGVRVHRLSAAVISARYARRRVCPLRVIAARVRGAASVSRRFIAGGPSTRLRGPAI